MGDDGGDAGVEGGGVVGDGGGMWAAEEGDAGGVELGEVFGEEVDGAGDVADVFADHGAAEEECDEGGVVGSGVRVWAAAFAGGAEVDEEGGVAVAEGVVGEVVGGVEADEGGEGSGGVGGQE